MTDPVVDPAVPAAVEPNGPAPVVTPTLTDKDAEIEHWKSWARKHEDAAKANAAAAAKLKEFEDRDLSELQKLQRDRDELSQKLTPLQQENARLHVALEKGLPKALVGRLQGSTVEELTADAEALMALVTQPVTPVVPQPRPDPSQGAQPSSVNTEDALFEQYRAAGHVLNNIRK